MVGHIKNSRLQWNEIGVICTMAIVTITGLGFWANIPGFLTMTALLGFCAFAIIYGRFNVRRAGSISVSDHTEPTYEAVLRQQARLADGISDPVLIINHNEHVTYANPSAQKLFSINDVSGPIGALIDDKAIQALISKTLAGDNPEPVILHASTPVERHIRVTGSLIETDGFTGINKQAVFVFYDITDLIRVNTMRADFLANASHELKTPVASLLGYIETLRGHAKDDPTAQEMFLGIMQQQAERMQRLIDDLLSLRRIEIVEHLVPTETGDLFLAARAAIEAVEPIAEKRDVSIKYDGPEEVLVTGIQDELVQLVLNLLDNAVVFTPEHDKVKLSIDIYQSFETRNIYSDETMFSNSNKRMIVPVPTGLKSVAVLKVRDWGPGFPKEHLPRVAERFYKVSETGAGQKRGTGLGLAIVKHIMRRHRGGLFLETQPGVGTEITVILPLKQMPS